MNDTSCVWSPNGTIWQQHILVDAVLTVSLQGSILIMAFFSLLIVILARKLEPLSSRGMFAYVYPLILIIFPVVFGFSRFLNPVQLSCYWFPLLRFPWITFSLFIHLLHSARYLAILNVQDHKNLLFQFVKREFEQNNVSQEMYDRHEKNYEGRSCGVLFVYRISQIFKSPWSAVPMSVLFAFAYIGSHALVIFLLNLDGTACMMATKWKMQIVSAVDIVFFVFVAALAMLIAILDFITFMTKRDACSLRSFFFREDPLRFRLQNLPTMGLLIMLNLFVKVGLWNLNSICEVEDFEINDILLNIMVWLSQIVLLFSLVWVILIATGIRLCRKRHEFKENDLEDMLKNVHQREMFQIYCDSEMNIENFMIWMEIQSYPASKDKLKSLKFILAQFLTVGSTMEVNVSSSVIRQIEADIESRNLTEHTLDSLKSEVYLNMKDIYSRFINSPEYIDYIKRRDTRNTLIRILL
jgi:hypothetical protein